MLPHMASLVLFAYIFSSYVLAWDASDIQMLLSKMEESYDRVVDYQVRIEVRTYKQDSSFKIEKFLYTFRKPKSIRLDFESPHSGMILVYPDREGKVVVFPSRLLPFLKFPLQLDSPRLRVPSGQRIDETDQGSLIKNIAHSVTDQRRGSVTVTDQNGTIRIQVLADDHFRKGVITYYQFFIDKKLWLPIRVEESTPDGRLERIVIFNDFKVNVGIPDSLFHQDG